jgi:hypothetical protein
MKTGYADIYYIFGILSGAKQPISKDKLRNKVVCRGSKFTAIFDKLLEKGFISTEKIQMNVLHGKYDKPDYKTVYLITPTGRALLSDWQTILMSLGLGDELSRFL